MQKYKSINPSFMSEIFRLRVTNRVVRSPYRLNLDIPKVSQVSIGNKSKISFEPKIFNSLPSHISPKFQKYSVCALLRPLLVCFRNSHQYNVTFRHQYSLVFWGGIRKGDQILKFRFSFIVMRKMFLEFFCFISIRYVICF